MAFFHVELTLRYTRISCMPYRATLDLDRFLIAENRADALHQAGLCLDRDLEEILANINTMNVADVLVDVRRVQQLTDREKPGESKIWNRNPFNEDLPLPRHIVIRDQRTDRQ